MVITADVVVGSGVDVDVAAADRTATKANINSTEARLHTNH